MNTRTSPIATNEYSDNPEPIRETWKVFSCPTLRNSWYGEGCPNIPQMTEQGADGKRRCKQGSFSEIDITPETVVLCVAKAFEEAGATASARHPLNLEVRFKDIGALHLQYSSDNEWSVSIYTTEERRLPISLSCPETFLNQVLQYFHH